MTNGVARGHVTDCTLGFLRSGVIYTLMCQCQGTLQAYVAASLQERLWTWDPHPKAKSCPFVCVAPQTIS